MKRWTRRRPPLPAVGQQLYDIPQVATFLGVSPWTVREIIWRGQMPIVKIGRLIRVDLGDLKQYVSGNREAQNDVKV